MTIAIYPGSFDPITNGHIDILKSGAEIFDKVIIAVSYNINKQGFLPIDERVALIKECVKDFPNVEGSYYAQIDNTARNLKVLLSPVSVIFTIPNNSSSITLDVIEISEMDDRMKEAFKNKDKEFFKKLFLNNMMLQTTLAEQHNASKLLKNYNALNESVNGIKKKANEDIYGDVVDAAIFQDKFKNLGTSTQAVFEKIASSINEDINLYLKRPFDYSEIGDLPIYKTFASLTHFCSKSLSG